MNINETNQLIVIEFNRIKEMVLEKNISYNNSLQNPNNIFSKSDVIEGIAKRLDDKINRITAAGINEQTIDTIDDIIGYLIHLRIAYNNKQ